MISGSVDCVAYSADDSWPCYISIKDDSSPRSLYFHKANHKEMCYFAEKAKSKGTLVKIEAEVEGDSANKIRFIYPLYSHSKWW